MIELNQLQYFVVSAELKSISRAAEVLKTKQPLISKLIKNMEEDLQVKLVSRNGHGIELTAAGEKVYQRAKKVLEDTESIYDIMQPKNLMELRISTNPSGEMATRFAGFYKEHEEITVRYTECDTKTVIENVANDISEIGLIFVEKSLLSLISYYCVTQKLEYTEITRNPICVNVGVNNPYYGRDSITVEELKKLKSIQTDVDLFSLNKHLERDKKTNEIEAPAGVTTNGNLLLVQLLMNSSLCYVGSPFLSRYYENNQIWALPVEGSEKCISVGYLKRQGSSLSENADAFLQYLRETCKLR
ncbi:MAG: LysR family transcriptional regulator [Lachnospiraceae bacterium]|nr:LysR family transcriptional regulator [Lachnospiraceae bacterium]MDD3615444.1 LysR family transcriptional regulator [Lachnospiraceae bacterium]